MTISDNGDTKTYHNELGQAHEALGVVVVNGDTMTYTNSLGQPKEAVGVVVLAGGEGGSVDWDDVQNKPVTFPPEIGATGTTAKAGDYEPEWGDIQSKPAVIAAGANAGAARTAIGLGTAATQASTSFATAAQGSLAASALQPADLSFATVSALEGDWRGEGVETLGAALLALQAAIVP